MTSFWNGQPLCNSDSTELGTVVLEHIQASQDRPEGDMPPVACLFQHSFKIHHGHAEIKNIEILFFICSILLVLVQL